MGLEHEGKDAFRTCQAIISISMTVLEELGGSVSRWEIFLTGIRRYSSVPPSQCTKAASTKTRLQIESECDATSKGRFGV